MAVELYHFWSSVCSVRCRMAIEEKGVPWTSRYIDLFKFDQLRPEYLAINPRGMVPTLVHDGKPIRESSVINEYIDAAFAGPALTPPDPLGAARMREFVFLCDEGFTAIAKLTLVKYILPKLRNRWSDDELRKQAARRPTKFYQDFHGRALRGEITNEELATARTTIDELLDHLEHTLKPGPSIGGPWIGGPWIGGPWIGGPWIVGEKFTLADISIAPYMFRLAALGADQFWSAERRPRVNAWYQQLAARPAFQIAVSWPDESGGGYEEVGLGAKVG